MNDYIEEEMFYLYDTEPVDLPEKVHVEPTSRCNLHCSICFRREWIGDQLGEMSAANFDRLAGQLAAMTSVREVFFGGMESRCFIRIFYQWLRRFRYMRAPHC